MSLLRGVGFTPGFMVRMGNGCRRSKSRICLQMQRFYGIIMQEVRVMALRSKSANINVRLYPETKQEAENIFAYHGLTLPEAITVFINHACHAGGFPFDLRGARWQDPVSLAALEECKQIEANPAAYKRYKNADELFADLSSDDDV